MVDLHIHSIYSDGTNTPTELALMAEASGLRAIALTDHDTLAGVPELLQATEHSCVEGIPGIELSVEFPHGTMHILGYFIDLDHDELNDTLHKIGEGRVQRNLEILKKLNRLGYVLQWSEVEVYAGGPIVGRPHFAEALLKRGYVKTKRAAFDLLLAKGRPAYAERYHCSAKECIALIRRAGGVAVLAHPSTLHLSANALHDLLRSLASEGLGGVETYYAHYHAETQNQMKQWAKELNLVCTGGTDYHGKHTPDLQLGVGFGQLHVPNEALEELKGACLV